MADRVEIVESDDGEDAVENNADAKDDVEDDDIDDNVAGKYSSSGKLSETLLFSIIRLFIRIDASSE